MIIKIKSRIHIELLLSCIVVSIIDLIFIQNPAFYKNNYIVYLVIPIVFTVMYGKKAMYSSLILSVFTLFLTLLISSFIYRQSNSIFYLKKYLSSFPLSLSATMVTLYVISIMLSRYVLQIEELKVRVKKLSLESLHYKRSTQALEIVNNEFESQLSRSRDSITTLYNQVEKLNKLNSKYVLQTFLETIQQFTMVGKATVWEYDDYKMRLNMVCSIGYYDDEPGPYLDIRGTVEGYVCRNNQFFSIRKIGDFQSIMIQHAKHNIMTIPINIGRKVWGVLNIEEIPFEKYSRYCEQLIHLIVSLAEPPLEKALDFESMVRHNDLDKITGLPFYSQFYSLLEDKLDLSWKDGSSLSIIIFDLLNFKELSDVYDRYDILELFSDSLISIFSDTGHDFFFFRYKEQNQIALLSTNLDQDGVSFYLVKVYRGFNEKVYLLENSRVVFEISVGYATQKDQKMKVDSILKEADNLLSMSKL